MVGLCSGRWSKGGHLLRPVEQGWASAPAGGARVGICSGRWSKGGHLLRLVEQSRSVGSPTLAGDSGVAKSVLTSRPPGVSGRCGGGLSPTS